MPDPRPDPKPRGINAARRLLFSFAQLSRKEMVFVHALFEGKTAWAAASAAGYRRSDGFRVIRRIAMRHPEFAEIAIAAQKRQRKKSGTTQPPPR